MPFDSRERKRSGAPETQRIYVCECGDVRVETKHTRQTFSPEEFIALLRSIAMNDKGGILPTIQKIGGIKMLRLF